MKYKMVVDKQENEIENIFNWIKNSKKHNDLSNPTLNGHCNNYGTHCCLSCDKCWGGKNKIQK